MSDQSGTIAERIVAHAPDAIISCDRSGTICLWNAGAERLFGWTPEEAVGRNLDIIIPDRHRAVHWKGWERVMDTGITRYGADLLAVPGLHRDGSSLSLEFSITVLHDSTGRVEGIAAILRDVSAQWQREKSMRERVRELESQEP